MAEAIADSGPPGHEDDINFLEIDFEDAADAALPNDTASTGISQDLGETADDFDFQINEYEVVDDDVAGEQPGAAEVPSGGFTQTELAVPQGNTAESEIGYEDEEPLEAEEALEAETAGHEFEATSHEQNNDSNADSSAKVDEIDYDDGDLEAVDGDDVAPEMQAAEEPSEQVEAAILKVTFDQALHDTAAVAESLEDQTAADDGPTHEPYEAGQQEDEGDSVRQAGEYPAGSATAAPGGEVSNVMVLYNGVKYELCASVHNDDPETYFFAGHDNLDAPLWEFFGRLRDVIKDEIEPSDNLMIKVPQLKLEFGEVCHANSIFPRDSGADLLQGTSNEFLDKHTFRDILNLYRRFKYNDGLEESEHPQLVVHLVAKPNCQERFAMLTEAAEAGRGWSEFFDNSDGSDTSSSRRTHSGQALDGDRGGSLFGNEEMEGTGGDVMQHDGVEIVEEAYFYDDTNGAGDDDAGHMFDGQDQDAEDLSHHAEDIADPNESYELAGELVENDEFDPVPDHLDENMSDDEDGPAHQMHTGQDGNGQTPQPDPTGALLGDADGHAGGSELESFDQEAAGSSLEASTTVASGNIPLSFRTSSDAASSMRQQPQDWLEDFMELDSKDTTPEMWKAFDALPRRSTPPPATAADGGDEDLIDYSEDEDSSEKPAIEYRRRFTPPPHFPPRVGKSILDVPTLSDLKRRPEDDADGEADDEVDEGLDALSAGTEGNVIPSIEQDDNDVFADAEGGTAVASGAWLKRVQPNSPSSASLERDGTSPAKPSRIVRRPVCMYRGVGTSRHSKAGQPARSSISPGQAALMMEPQNAAGPAYAFSSGHNPRAHFSFASGSGLQLSKHTGANLPNLQAQQDPGHQPGAGLETAHVSEPRNDLERGDGGNSANNDQSIDMEGFVAYDEAGANEPLVADSHTQVTDSHNTSATSTVNGDEITYEDESTAPAETGNGAQEAGDEAAENGDEIDWENDGIEDVAVAENPTNVSSPSGLSVKRVREDDDLISLDDETGMPTPIEYKRRCTILIQPTDAKRRKI